MMVPGETFCKEWAEGRRKKKGKRKYENRKSAVLQKQRESEHSSKEGAVSSAKNQRMHPHFTNITFFFTSVRSHTCPSKYRNLNLNQNHIGTLAIKESEKYRF